MREQKIRDRIVGLLRAGRHGRAARLFHRWQGTSIRLEKDENGRVKIPHPDELPGWGRSPR